MKPIYGPDSVSATRSIQPSLWWLLGSTRLHVIQVLFLEALLSISISPISFLVLCTQI